MSYVRPSGMVERLRHEPQPHVLETYGRVKPGPVSAEALLIAARQDRRRRRRRDPDPLRGRLIDLRA